MQRPGADTRPGLDKVAARARITGAHWRLSRSISMRGTRRVDDGRRWRAHGVRAVSTMVDDGGRELGGTSVLQLRPAERITAYAAIHPLTAPKTTKVPSCWKTPIRTSTTLALTPSLALTYSLALSYSQSLSRTRAPRYGSRPASSNHIQFLAAFPPWGRGRSL